MNLSKLIIYFVVIILLFTLLPVAAAQDQAQGHVQAPMGTRATDPYDMTAAREWLDVDVVALFQQPDYLEMDITYYIHEIYLSPPYNQLAADEIRVLYEYERKTIGNNPPILTSLLQKIKEKTGKIANQTTASTNLIFYDPVQETSSFYGSADENKYEPPLVIRQECSIKLSELAYFTSAEVARYNIKRLSDLLAGSLKMGARVNLDLDLYAGAGHKIKYIFKVNKFEEWSDDYQDQLTITHSLNEIFSKDKDKVTFTIDNLNNLYHSVREIKDIVFRAKIVNLQSQETIRHDFNLMLKDFDELLINRSTITINSIKIREEFFKLPSNISDLTFLSTDGLRLYMDNGLLDLADIEQSLAAEFSRLERQFATVFNTTDSVVLNKTWDMSTIIGLSPLYYLYDTGSMNRMGSERPIICHLSVKEESAVHLFGNVTSMAVKGLLNAGARAELNLYISSPYMYTYNLTLPAGFLLSGHTPKLSGEPGIGGVTYLLTPDKLKNLRVVAIDPAQYTSSRANITVNIDIHEVEILGVSEYLAHVKIDADGILHHIKNERGSEFDEALPKGVTMDYYNSDALRLMYTEGLLDLPEIEESLYSKIEENISKMLEKDVKMIVSFNDELLEFDGNIHEMDDLDPVTFGIRSSGKMRITEDKLVRMGGFVTKQLELPLPGAKYWNVTYRLVLPEHIYILGRPRVENSSVEYFGPMVDRTDDNRDELIVTICGEPYDEASEPELEVDVQVDIDITIWFFLNKIVAAIILFIVLCIVIAIIQLHRRHKSKKIEQLMADPDLAVEEEDFSMGMGGRSYKRPSRTVAVKERRFVDFDTGRRKKDDYSERLEELRPRRAMGHAERKATGKGRGRASRPRRSRGSLSRRKADKKDRRSKRDRY